MPRSSTIDRLIARLQLQPLPGEGGFFRQTWCGASASAIYFLLTRDEFSALHRLDADEMWHFYAGDPIEHVQLDPASKQASVTRLGPNILDGEIPQLFVPAGVWQGARLVDASSEQGFALLGCTVSPAWHDGRFTLGDRAELTREFPSAAAWVKTLTR
jgi:hypothetical protein